MKYSESYEEINKWRDTNDLCCEEVQAASSSLDSVLQERGSRYGSFESNAQISQNIKSIMHGSANWHTMPDYMKESLHMIAHKISRILEGDCNYDDSWVDIAGYATLVVEEINNEHS